MLLPSNDNFSYTEAKNVFLQRTLKLLLNFHLLLSISFEYLT